MFNSTGDIFVRYLLELDVEDTEAIAVAVP